MAEDTAAAAYALALRRCVPGLAALTAVLAIVTEPGSALENAVAAAAVLPFVVWALRPSLMPSIVLVVLVGAAEVAALRSGELEALLFLMSIAAIVIGAWEESRVATVVAGALAVATPLVVELVARDDVFYGVWMMGVLLPLLLSRLSRWQLRLAAELTEARQELARQGALEEKRAIARDVHDLVGHGLAAMLLHVSGARHVLRRDVDQADEALADAENVGRRSLQDLRQTLTVLRDEHDSSGGRRPPVPSASDIGAAVLTARAAGVDAAFRLVGDDRRIDPIVGLSLHRVAEEALANARRHAPDAVTDVVLTIEADAVELTIDSLGAVANGADEPDRPRYGLVGMRERMAAVGGELEAGPTATGWRVRCRAPLAVAGTT